MKVRKEIYGLANNLYVPLSHQVVLGANDCAIPQQKAEIRIRPAAVQAVSMVVRADHQIVENS